MKKFHKVEKVESWLDIICQYILDKNAYVTYTILFSIIFAIGFRPVWADNRILMWGNDAVHVYYPILNYSSQFFREIIQNLISGDFRIAFFDFRVGLGGDAFTTQINPSTLNLIDILSVFVPPRHIATFYSVTMIVKFYLSGIAFLYFSKYMKSENYIALFGALAYVFCAWALSGGVRHAFFLQATVFMPLMIVALDKVFTQGKAHMLMLITFLFALTGFYFLYIVYLFFIPYTIIRIHWLYPQGYLKKLFQRGGLAVASTLVGLIMAAFFFLPTVLFFLDGSRPSNVNVESLWFFDLPHYRDFLMRFIGGHPNQFHILFPAIIVIAIAWLFTRPRLANKWKLHLLALFLVVLVARLIPAGNLMLNGFGYVSPRWMFLFSFVLAFILIKALPEIFELKGIVYFVSVVLALVYGVTIIVMDMYRNIHFFFSFSMLVLAIAILAYSPKEKFKLVLHSKKILLLVAVVINVVTNVWFMNTPAVTNYTASFMQLELLEDRNVHLPEDILPQSGEFYRIDVINTGPHTSMLRGYFGLTRYQSLHNPYVMQLVSSLESNPMCAVPFYIGNWNHSTFIHTLFSVRYSVTTARNRTQLSRVPYGYVEIESNMDGVYVFKNNFELPLGFTYSNSIPYELFINLNPVQQKEIMMRYVILQDIRGSTHSFNALGTLQTTSLPFTILEADGITWEDGVFIVNRSGLSMTLGFEGLPNSETYVRLVGFDNDERGRTNLTVASSVISTGLRATFWRDDYYIATQAYNYTINLGYSYAPLTQATITFANGGTFALDDIQILALPMDNFPSYVENLRQYTLTNLNLHERGLPGLTNRITGEISVTSDQYLFLNIPYSRGWRAYVNGVPTQINRANIAFMAIQLSPGHHEIELRYRTPGLRAGVVFSIIGFAIFATTVKYNKRIASWLDNKNVKQ